MIVARTVQALLIGAVIGVVALRAQDEETSETYRELFERTYRYQPDVPSIGNETAALASRLHQAGANAFPVLTEIFSSTDEMEKKTAIVNFFIVHDGEKTELLSQVRNELGEMVLQDTIHDDRNRPFLCQSLMLLGQDGGAVGDLDLARRLQDSKISIVRQFAENAEREFRRRPSFGVVLAEEEVELRRILAQREGAQELSEVVQELSAATPKERRESVDLLIRIVRKEIELPPWERNFLIGKVAYILMELGDTPAILLAFSEDLEKFGDRDEFSAVAALASCRGSAALEAIEPLVRRKMEAIPESDQGPPVEAFNSIGEPIESEEDPAMSFVTLLVEMSRSQNPEIVEAARLLRDEFAVSAKGSKYRRRVLGELDREMGVRQERTSSWLLWAAAILAGVVGARTLMRLRGRSDQ